MLKIPKFADLFKEIEVTDDMKSKYAKQVDESINSVNSQDNEELYIENFTDEEVSDFIDLMSYSDLFTEADSDGNVKPTALIKTSKEILDLMTDGKWSKFTKEEKAEFLKNYIWDGTKFVPTKTGRLKAAIVKASGTLFGGFTPSNFTATTLADASIKAGLVKISGKKLSKEVIVKILKSAPKGAALSIVIPALIQAAGAAAVTSPKSKSDLSSKILSNDKLSLSDYGNRDKSVDVDFAKQFDDSIKSAKSNIKKYASKLKGLLGKK